MENPLLETTSVVLGGGAVTAEIADSESERQLGLMNRRSLASDAGMIFVFEAAVQDPFWMQNTYVSLDIIFLDASKRIVYLAKETTPLSEDYITPNSSYFYALEVNAGYCDAHNVSVGDYLEFSLE
jgi:uncharacterized membrane protein (UPF0127 family)